MHIREHGNKVAIRNLQRLVLASVAACMTWASTAHAVVLVYFEPASLQVEPGSVFSIQMLADIPQPVVGWGLDMSLTGPHVSIGDPPAIGPAWLAGSAPDGDGLLGVAFPGSVAGDSVLLATLYFEAISPGEVSLAASATTGDLNEGFALDPSGFDDFTADPATITVLPEPASLGIGLVIAFLIHQRRKREGRNASRQPAAAVSCRHC